MLLSASVATRHSRAGAPLLVERWAHSPDASRGERHAFSVLRRAAASAAAGLACEGTGAAQAPLLFIADVDDTHAAPIADRVRAAEMGTDTAATRATIYTLVHVCDDACAAHAHAHAHAHAPVAVAVTTRAFSAEAARRLLGTLLGTWRTAEDDGTAPGPPSATALARSARGLCDETYRGARPSATLEHALYKAIVPFRRDTLSCIASDLRATRHSLVDALAALYERGERIERIVACSDALVAESVHMQREVGTRTAFCGSLRTAAALAAFHSVVAAARAAHAWLVVQCLWLVER